MGLANYETLAFLNLVIVKYKDEPSKIEINTNKSTNKKACSKVLASER